VHPRSTDSGYYTYLWCSIFNKVASLFPSSICLFQSILLGDLQVDPLWSIVNSADQMCSLLLRIPPDVCIIIETHRNSLHSNTFPYVELSTLGICYIVRFRPDFITVIQTWPNRLACKPPLWLHYNSMLQKPIPIIIIYYSCIYKLGIPPYYLHIPHNPNLCKHKIDSTQPRNPMKSIIIHS
jgi:hypothetical protein